MRDKSLKKQIHNAAIERTLHRPNTAVIGTGTSLGHYL